MVKCKACEQFEKKFTCGCANDKDCRCPKSIGYCECLGIEMIYSKGLDVTIAQRDRMVGDVHATMTNHPSNDYTFQYTGNAFVIGLRLDDGIAIYDTIMFRTNEGAY
jgi:hypothetical protein